MKSIIPNLKHALACVAILAVAILAGAPGIAAQEADTDGKVVTIHVETPGTLAELLRPVESTVEQLTVTGSINADDFGAMWRASLYHNLMSIDLSGTSVEGNEVPHNAFFHMNYQFLESGIIVPKLKRIVLPEGIQTIGQSAFTFCYSLEEINLPQSLEIIGRRAFERTFALRSVEFPAGLKKIENVAFDYSGIEHAIFPEGLERIGRQAFMNSKLVEITVPGNCELDGGIFSGCLELERAVLEQGITELPTFTFNNCLKLSEIEWPSPNTITVLGICAISSWSLPSFHIPEGVERLEMAALAYNEYTTQFSLPTTLKFVDYEAFYSCSDVEIIYCAALTPPECGFNPYTGETPFQTIPATAVLYVPVGMAELYRAAPGWSYFQNIQETDQFPQAGLEQPAVVAPAEADAPVYNLQGMRVTNPQRGQLYIIGGRKVVY